MQTERLSLGAPRPPRPRGTDAVRETDTDALRARLAACRAGYLAPDPYAERFAPPLRRAESLSRAPLISIGTYLRAAEMDKHTAYFVQHGTLAPAPTTQEGTPPVQIVSLGAGSDTRFWRMYLELDFPASTQHKAQCIAQDPELSAAVGPYTRTDDGLVAARYAVRGTDLTTLRTSELWAWIEARLDPARPTLIVCECVLAYLDARAADTLLASWLETWTHAAVLSYDMCVAGDDTGSAPSRFGQMMLDNLAARHLALPGARQCLSLAAYRDRFARLVGGAPDAQDAYTLLSAWRALPRAERERLTMLERLDEMEEMEMLLSHYCIAWVQRSMVH